MAITKSTLLYSTYSSPHLRYLLFPTPPLRTLNPSIPSQTLPIITIHPITNSPNNHRTTIPPTYLPSTHQVLVQDRHSPIHPGKRLIRNPQRVRRVEYGYDVGDDVAGGGDDRVSLPAKECAWRFDEGVEVEYVGRKGKGKVVVISETHGCTLCGRMPVVTLIRVHRGFGMRWRWCWWVEEIKYQCACWYSCLFISLEDGPNKAD